MRSADIFALSFGSLRAHKLRTTLSVLGIAIGISAVILITAIGEGTRQFLMKEFTQFGTNIFQINPGKIETSGLPGIFGGTTRKLTIDDAEALRRVRGVGVVLPTVTGQGRVEAGRLGRSVYVIGVNSQAPELWNFEVRSGTFIKDGDPRRGAQEVVLGPKLAAELFGEPHLALGQWVRIAGSRMRVVGVTAPKGLLFNFDMDDLCYVPVATAMRLFNLDELMEINVTFLRAEDADRVVEEVRALLIARHGGHEDFTLFTQAQMLTILDSVLRVITLGVAGIGAISLLVGAIGILTMMWIAVGERTHEIGLLRALGARSAEVQRIFLMEAVGLSITGGVLGLSVGVGGAWLLRVAIPGLPVQVHVFYMVLALAVALVTGLVSGVAPARRAARLDPVVALRAE